MLNDANLQKVLLALVSNNVTHTIYLGRNLDLDLDVYNFGEDQEVREEKEPKCDVWGGLTAW